MTEGDNKYRMAGIGEILWDLLPDGRQLGGSPMNVVYHCNAAGINSVVVSAVGRDSNGKEILDLVCKKGNSTSFIHTLDSHPTGTVSVKLDMGIPDFTIHNDVAWDYIPWSNALLELAENIDAVAFGSLAQRNEVSRETIRKFISNMKPGSIRVFDINLRQDFHSREILDNSLKLATILKINDEELPVLANYYNISGSDYQIAKKLMEKFKLDLLALTRGSKGSTLFSREIISVKNAPEVKIKDTVGAGDTFTGVMIAGLLKNKPIEEIHKDAVETAAWVCSKEGGTPAYEGLRLKA
jgi:fructokinase